MSGNPEHPTAHADAAPTGETVSAVADTAAPVRASSLKDRIADLSAAGKSGAARAAIVDRVKALQQAVPAATDVKQRLKDAAAAVRLEKLNRDTLKAGRDSLAAKVEALIKARPVGPAQNPPTPTTSAEAAATPPAAAGGDAMAETSPQPQGTADGVSAATTAGGRDVRALKERLDTALKARAGSNVPSKTTTADAPADTFESSAAAAAPFAKVDGPPQAAEPRSSSGSSVTDRLKTLTARLRPATDRGRAQPPSDTAPTPAGAKDAAASAPIEIPEIPTIRSRSLVTERLVRAEAEAERRRPIFSLGLLLTAVTAGGILHILTTLAVPMINAGSAFERLRWQLETNVMRVFPADPNGQTPLPFLTADMRYAMCRFDLSSNSVQVAAVLPDIGWSLTLYTPQGDNFYAVPGLEGRVVTAQFSLSVASDRLLLPVPGVRRADTDATQVTSPQREGLIVVRAPNLGPANLVAVEEALKQSSCRVTARR